LVFRWQSKCFLYFAFLKVYSSTKSVIAKNGQIDHLTPD
jgi:hypothetical protein